MSSARIQKLFCGIYSTFKCSFDEFVGEKVFSPSYSSAILAPPLSFLYIVQLSHPYMTTGKAIALTRWTFVGKILSLLFNMPSRFGDSDGKKSAYNVGDPGSIPES